MSKLAFSIQNDIRVYEEFDLDKYMRKFKIDEKKATKNEENTNSNH